MNMEKSLVGIASAICEMAEEMGVDSIHFYNGVVMSVRNVAAVERFARMYGVPLEEESEGSMFVEVECHPADSITVRCCESMHYINEIEERIRSFNEELEEL